MGIGKQLSEQDFFSTQDDASDAAGHLLRGTMWEHNDGIFNPITRPPYTIH